jgi:hypothetical protein
MDVGFSGVPLFLTLQCAVDANVIVVIRLKGTSQGSDRIPECLQASTTITAKKPRRSKRR